MQLRFLFLLLFLCSGKLFAQHPCCLKSSCQEFAMLGKDKKFQMLHERPLPFKYTLQKGKMISFSTPDGNTGKAFEVKGTSNRVVLMFHEWWGLNDYIKQEAEKLQSELGDVTVLAFDLYDGKVTSKPDEAAKLVQSVSENRIRNIIKGGISYAGPNTKIGTIGWCFGGGWSLQSALEAEKQSIACVMYYGMPEKDKDKLKKLNAPVLGIFAKQDDHITPDLANEFKMNMKEMGKDIIIKFYDAAHAFANPSNPKFNKEAAEDARRLVISFLKDKLMKN